ncbi:sulfatase-like hydrolase/transferase, partial [Paracoccaceae bacterium]|nr:sulfatase-like hydrolase/transferase [Paracoccaceae bacterium]
MRRLDTIKNPGPNILFIVFDQMRADALTGPLADTVELPNFTQFKNESVNFLNHFSVTSPCGPARASLLTGQYAMNHRSIRNGTPLAHDTPNLALSLRHKGIEPLLYGYTDTSQDPRIYERNDPILTSYEEVLNGFTEVQEMRFDTNKSWKNYLKEKNYKFDELFEIFEPINKKINAPAKYSADDSDTAFLTDCLLKDLQTRKKGWCAHVT